MGTCIKRDFFLKYYFASQQKKISGFSRNLYMNILCFWWQSKDFIGLYRVQVFDVFKYVSVLFCYLFCLTITQQFYCYVYKVVDKKSVHVKTHVYVTRYEPYLKTKLPCLFQVHLALSEITFYTFYKRTITTGYNQSVTCCDSQRKHVVVTQRKLI